MINSAEKINLLISTSTLSDSMKIGLRAEMEHHSYRVLDALHYFCNKNLKTSISIAMIINNGSVSITSLSTGCSGTPDYTRKLVENNRSQFVSLGIRIDTVPIRVLEYYTMYTDPTNSYEISTVTPIHFKKSQKKGVFVEYTPWDYPASKFIKPAVFRESTVMKELLSVFAEEQ